MKIYTDVLMLAVKLIFTIFRHLRSDSQIALTFIEKLHLLFFEMTIISSHYQHTDSLHSYLDEAFRYILNFSRHLIDKLLCYEV